MFISTLLYLSSGTSKNLLSLSDSNSAFASPSISPPKPSNPGEKSFPIWAPFSNVIRPMAMSSYFLERNSFLLLNAENTLRSVASLRSILLIMSITVPPPNPDIWGDGVSTNPRSIDTSAAKTISYLVTSNGDSLTTTVATAVLVASPLLVTR